MLSDHFIESTSFRMNSRSLLILLIAILFHIIILLSILALSLWKIEYIDESRLKVTLMESPLPLPPPPPPPLKGKSMKSDEIKPNLRYDIPQVDIPEFIPEIIPEHHDIAEHIGDGGVEWGSEFGEEGGVLGGVPGGVIGGIPGAPPNNNKPEYIGEDGRPPQLIYQVEPEYPESARRAHITGVVLLEIVVKQDGTVGQVKILRSIESSLDLAAIEAVKKFKFQPGMVKGKPVNSYFLISISFSIME